MLHAAGVNAWLLTLGVYTCVPGLNCMVLWYEVLPRLCEMRAVRLIRRLLFMLLCCLANRHLAVFKCTSSLHRTSDRSCTAVLTKCLCICDAQSTWLTQWDTRLLLSPAGCALCICLLAALPGTYGCVTPCTARDLCTYQLLPLSLRQLCQSILQLIRSWYSPNRQRKHDIQQERACSKNACVRRLQPLYKHHCTQHNLTPSQLSCSCRTDHLAREVKALLG